MIARPIIEVGAISSTRSQLWAQSPISGDDGVIGYYGIQGQMSTGARATIAAIMIQGYPSQAEELKMDGRPRGVRLDLMTGQLTVWYDSEGAIQRELNSVGNYRFAWIPQVGLCLEEEISSLLLSGQS